MSSVCKIGNIDRYLSSLMSGHFGLKLRLTKLKLVFDQRICKQIFVSFIGHLRRIISIIVFRIILVCINVVIFQQRVPVLEPGPEQPDPRLHGAGAGWACLARHHGHAPAWLLPPPPAAAPPHGRRTLPAGLRGRQQGLGSSQNWR